uniref:carbohydrate binding domain-containing protein n=1 Tax=Paenibacillus ehimensis TaxID=79264 RepID=UPI0013E2F7AA
NMLANASFEVNTGTSGLADGWYGNKDQGITGEYEVVAHHASAGQRAQKITGSGLGLYNQINVFQDTKIEPGKTYTASSRIFVESLANAKVNLTVDYLDEQYRFTGAHFETSQNTTTGGGFSTLSVTGQAPANAAYARVWLVLMGTDNNGSGIVYWDAATLQPK